MTWMESVPTGIACAAWLFGPGLLVTFALGLRGIAVVAAAPVVSVAVIATTAVVAGAGRIAWSLPLAITVCAVIGVVANLVSITLRRHLPVVHRVDRRGVTIAALAGLVPGVLLGGLVFVRALRRPEALSQTFDAAFHYNALATIIDTRNGSSLTMASLRDPGTPATFYPAAFHDLGSLVLMSTGANIPATANLLAMVIALLAWPLAAILLVRQILGAGRGAMIVAGVVSTGFAAFPWGLLAYGVLWPNTLGMVFVPVGLAAILSIMGLAEDDIIGRPRAWVLLGLTGLGGGFAHPNALFSLIVLGIVPVLAGLVRRAGRMRGPRRLRSGVTAVAIAVAAFCALWWWAATSPIFASARTVYWAPFESTSAAVTDVLISATRGRSASWPLAALILLGAIACWWSRRRRWLVVAHAVAGTLYVLTASVNRPGTQKYTGYWYNDSFRLSAMLTITAVPLTVAGVAVLASWISAAAPRAVPAVGRLRPLASASMVAVMLTGILVVATNGFAFTSRTATLAMPYAPGHGDPASTLITVAERRFFARVRGSVPAGAVVANNPWDGSVLLWALGGRRVLVSHLGLTRSDDQRYLGEHLVDAATDPRVCEAANRLKVEYMIVGDGHFWRWESFTRDYEGITDPGARPGFELVDAEGANRLYRLTACATA